MVGGELLLWRRAAWGWPGSSLAALLVEEVAWGNCTILHHDHWLVSLPASMSEALTEDTSTKSISRYVQAANPII